MRLQVGRNLVELADALGRQQKLAGVVLVAEVDVLVLRLDDLVAGGRNHLDHIAAGGNRADDGAAAAAVGQNRPIADLVEGVAAVEDPGTDLVPDPHAVVAVGILGRGRSNGPVPSLPHLQSVGGVSSQLSVVVVASLVVPVLS